jgi:thioredoxin 1
MANISEINVSNWEKEVSKSDILTVVYFWHERCPWCMRLNPIFDDIAREYAGKMRFAKLNILENPTNQEMATNLGVLSTPTLMFFCSGKSVGQVVGAMSKEELEKTLGEILGRYRTCLRQSTDLRSYIV